MDHYPRHWVPHDCWPHLRVEQAEKDTRQR